MLRIDDDGNFVIDSASFDIPSRQPTLSEFDGTGNWWPPSDGETILFENPEQTDGITFHLRP